jgi:hypothetical protein
MATIAWLPPGSDLHAPITGLPRKIALKYENGYL